MRQRNAYTYTQKRKGAACLAMCFFVLLLFIRTLPAAMAAPDLSTDYQAEQPDTTPDLSSDYTSGYYSAQAEREITDYLAEQGVSIGESEDASAEYTRREIEKLDRKLAVIDDIIDVFAGANGLFTGLSFLFVGANMFIWIIRELERDADRPGLDAWTRVFVMTGVSFAVIANLDYIFDGITQVGKLIETTVTSGVADVVTKVVVGDFSSVTSGVTSAEEYLSFDNHMTMIRVLTTFLNCAIDSIVYAVGIRMTIRKIFAPLAVADMSVNGMKSPGYRYLLRFLAYYIQIGIIYAATVAFVVVYAIALNAGTGITWLWTTVAAKGALATVIAGSGQLSREFINAD